MKTPLITFFSALALAFPLVGSTQGAVLLEYDFLNNSDPSTEDPAVNGGTFSGSFPDGQIQRSGSTETFFVRSGDSNGANNFEETLNAALTSPDYFSFTVEPTGDPLDLEKLDFDWGGLDGDAEATWEFSYAVFSDVDGFSEVNAIAQGSETLTSTDTFHAQSIDLSGSQFDAISSNTEFRIYFWNPASNRNDGDAFDIGRIDNVQLTGSVVPEPSAATLLFLAIGSLVVFRRRRSV